MKVAIAQIEAPNFAQDQNERKVLRLVEKAIDEKAELVLFPEAVNLGYFVLDQAKSREATLSLALETAPSLSSPWIEELKRQARRGIFVACGSILRTKENRLVNALLLIPPSGEVFAYHKTHLYHYKEAREEHYIAPGSALKVIDTDLAKIGLAICYDLNFPEVSRNLALKGAQLILVAAAWPKMAGEVWNTLLAARAMENEVYILASNQIGKEYCGLSKVIDYSGRIVTEFEEEEGLKTAEIDLKRQEKWRTNVTLLQDRRPELYLL
jgi:predicted amidohydrolase